MIISDFKERIAVAGALQDDYPPKVQAIIRSPGNEHLVSRGELEAARLDGEKPRRGKDEIRLCAFECGRPASQDHIYCSQCRLELTRL